MSISAAAEEAVRLEGHGGPIKGVAALPGGDQVLTASFDYAIGLWRVRGGERIAWLEGHRAQVTSVATTADGRFAISGSDDFSLIIWDLAAARRGEPALHKRLTGHRGKVGAVAVSRSGELAASAGWDGVAKIWRAPSGELKAETKALGASVTAIAFTSDDEAIITGGADGRIRLWRVTDGAPLATAAEHGFAISALATGGQGDGQWAAYGAADGALVLLDLASGRDIARFQDDRTPILALAVAPSGKVLATGDGAGRITVYRDGGADMGWVMTRRFNGAARGPIWALAFLDEDRVAAAGLDASAAIWPISAPAAGRPALASGARPDFQTDPAAMTNGERQFKRKCAVCHTVTPDSGRRAGPTLYGVFGRKAGGLPGYVYSPAMKTLDITWSEKTIDALFEVGPDHYTPGSKMPMQRITRRQDRLDLIAYLRSATAPSTTEERN